MTIDLAGQRALVFDCDGVVLDSNAVKTRAFERVVGDAYGGEVARRFVAYHEANGGVSRYAKFAHLVTAMLGREARPGEVEALCDRFSEQVVAGLDGCPLAPRLDELRAATAGRPWFVVSGGDQQELRAVFALRGLAPLFDGGIFGSPATKPVILGRLLEAGVLERPALLLGDSRVDFESARDAGLGFVFIYGWTDLHAWREVFPPLGVPCLRELADLLPASIPGDSP